MRKAKPREVSKLPNITQLETSKQGFTLQQLYGSIKGVAQDPKSHRDLGDFELCFEHGMCQYG